MSKNSNTFRLDGKSYDILDRVRLRGSAYLVVEEYGGGQGGVLKAIDPHRKRLVAVRWRDGSDKGYLPALRRAAHDNPAFPMILDHGKRQDKHFVVMPWVHGQTLAAHLSRRQEERFRISAKNALQLTRTLALGVERLHSNRLIHGDISPANLVVKRKPLRLMLIDFGAAWTADIATHRTNQGSMRYAAPERILGHELADERVDQYSIGTVLYEMLTGNIPYTIGGMAANDPSPPPLVLPRTLNSESWPALDQVVAQAVALDPNQRFGSSRQFVEALRDAERRPASTMNGFKRFWSELLSPLGGRP